MKYRKLGKNKDGDTLEVSALGLGCMPMAGIGNAMYGEANVQESLATIDRAIELGVTLFDTAEVYGPHMNEELVGRGIKDRANRLVIATKFGFKFDENGFQGVDSSPANVRRACEGSLKRLGVDTIDLLYQHRVDPDVPIAETVGEMGRLVEEGKVRFLGLSEAGMDTIKAAHKEHPIAALQSEYSLWERGIEDDILPLCEELGIGFVPYSPLGRGFLPGQIKSLDDLPEDDFRHKAPRDSEENFAQNMKMVEEVREIASEHNCSPAQIALAWLLAQGDSIVPIPGSKRRATLEDSMAAVEVRLDADDLERLDKAAPVGATAGLRYRAEMMKMVRI